MIEGKLEKRRKAVLGKLLKLLYNPLQIERVYLTLHNVTLLMPRNSLWNLTQVK